MATPTVEELQAQVWDRTPSFRRTWSHGKRLIVMCVGNSRFGPDATEWVSIETMTEKELQDVLESYGGAS